MKCIISFSLINLYPVVERTLVESFLSSVKLQILSRNDSRGFLVSLALVLKKHDRNVEANIDDTFSLLSYH